MKTVDEHNAERQARHKSQDSEDLLGVSCPVCGNELVNPSPGFIYTTNPPQIKTKCNDCGYGSFVLA